MGKKRKLGVLDGIAALATHSEVEQIADDLRIRDRDRKIFISRYTEGSTKNTKFEVGISSDNGFYKAQDKVIKSAYAEFPALFLRLFRAKNKVSEG
jgi:hypothetical protein